MNLVIVRIGSVKKTEEIRSSSSSANTANPDDILAALEKIPGVGSLR